MTTPTELTVERERELITQLKQLRKQIDVELSRVIVGQKEVVRQLLISLLAGGNCLITGAPGLAKTLLVKSIAQLFGQKCWKKTVPVDDPCDSFRGRFSPTFCWPTKSIVRHPRRSPLCWKPCRNIRSLPPVDAIHWMSHSLCLPRRTRSRWKARTHCPKLSSIGLCLTS